MELNAALCGTCFCVARRLRLSERSGCVRAIERFHRPAIRASGRLGVARSISPQNHQANVYGGDGSLQLPGDQGPFHFQFHMVGPSLQATM